ncbi:putative EMP1-like protein, partial [Plasmodium gaboni]
NLSINVQCMLKNISNHLIGDNRIEELMKRHFKEAVENKLNEEHVYADIKNTPCNLDDTSYTNKPQCLRFLEEWFEEFIQKKKIYEERMKQTCLEGKIITQNLIGGQITAQLGCSLYCNEYNKFLRSRKECYGKYIRNCIKENPLDQKSDPTLQADMDATIRQMKNKYNCGNDCGEPGEHNLNLFFNPNILSQHETFCCSCINTVGDIKEIFGKDDNESSYIDAILNKLSTCAIKDDTLDGAKNGKIKTNSGNDTDICKIHYTDSFLKGKETCIGIPCNNYYQKKKEWICDSKKQISGEQLKTGWSDGTKSACLPPRTQRLCLGRIYDNNCTEKRIENIDTNEKLLNELIIAARFEGTQLYNKYITHDQTKNRTEDEKMKRLCNAAKYSFADLGDIVKGTSIWENNDTRTMERKLISVFKKIYEKIDKANQEKYKDSTKPAQYLNLREIWWNTNRKHIWKALVCSIEKSDTKKSFSCISKDEPPNIDYMPQFLRFLEEYSQYICEEQKEKLNHVQQDCKLCKEDAFKCSSKDSHECTKCYIACEKYKDFMLDSQNKYNKQKSKYISEIDKYVKNIKKSNNAKNTNDEFYNLIKRDYKNIGYFLNERLKDDKNSCNLKYNNNIDFNNENKVFKEIPEGYDKACNCKNIKNYTKYDEKINVPLKANLEKSACMLDQKDNVYGNKGTLCNNSKSAGTVKHWECNLNNNSVFRLRNGWNNDKNDNGACLPPRTQEICLANLSKEDLKSKIDEKSNYDNVKNTKLLTEIALAAKHEGALLWELYKNNPSLACMKLRNSYSDYGDLVKGTSIWENTKSKTAEDNIGDILKNIFKDKFKSDYKEDINKLREDWWKANRQDIWNAMTCEIPDYATFVITKKPSDGQGIEYNVTGKCGYSQETPKDDEIPQFLRWFKEWSSDFCTEKNKYDINNAFVNTIGEDKNILSMCKGCSTSGTDCLSTYVKSNYKSSYVTCATCQKTCKEYKDWINNQNSEFSKQKNKYEDLINKAKEYRLSNLNSNVDISFNKTTEYLQKLKDQNMNGPDQYLQSNIFETQCFKNIDVDFTNIHNTFNEKHKYCRTCDEQPHLKEMFPHLNFTQDGIDNYKPGDKPTGNDETHDVDPNSPVKPTESTKDVAKNDDIDIDNSKGINCMGVKELSMVKDGEIDICMPYNYELDGSGVNKQNRKKYMISHIPTIDCTKSVFHKNNNGGCSDICPCHTNNANTNKWIWTKENGNNVGLKKDNNYANKIG